MTATFHERMAVLRAMTGETLRGEVIVDQIYAHYQHERLDLRHPRGGQALYLQAPLYANFRAYLAAVARGILEDGGWRAMSAAMEDLAGPGGVATYAPVEFGFLRHSGHPRVLYGEHPVYDRPPEAHRLSREELRALNRLRPLPPALIGWIWWHVMRRTGPPPRSGWRR